MEMSRNLSIADVRKVEFQIIDALEESGILSLQQIYVLLDIEPDVVGDVARGLYNRGLIEEIDESVPVDLPVDMKIIYGLSTGRGRTRYSGYEPTSPHSVSTLW